MWFHIVFVVIGWYDLKKKEVYTMKKIVTFFILVLVAICFTACVESKDSDGKNTEVVSTQIENAENENSENECKEGYMTNNNVCTQDEYEQTLFGQPISKERDGEIRLGIKCIQDSDAELTIYKAEGGKYVSIFSCPAKIGKNGPGKHAEGDTKTPLGTWVVGEAYGIKENPGSLLPYTQVTDDMYWCASGSNAKKYNQLIYKSDDPDADYSEDEHLMDYPIRYAYFIDLGYNKACAPYAGNAIFLHVWKEEDGSPIPTGGCVAVSEESMVTIIKTLKPETVVTIY